jgi:hypothetical protein
MLKINTRKVGIALFTLLALCFAGCATKVPMPKGSSKGYSTVRFITPNKPLGPDNLPVFIQGNAMIKKSIAAQMEANGLKVVEDRADLIVAHLIIMQDNTSTSYSNQYFGRQDFSDLVTLAHKEGMKQQYAEYVQKRALVIDIIDARTSKLVYRNYAVGGSLANATEQERQARIDGAVAETLARFFQ